MTRLPVENWLAEARHDIQPYVLNTVCPVTGEEPVEDHHLWRRSFTAQGREGNQSLYWVQVGDRIYPNRIGLSHDVHRKVTENEAWLEFDEDGRLFYREGNEEKELDVHFQLLALGEEVKSTKRKRKPRAKGEERRKTEMTRVRTPAGEENLLYERIDLLREKLGPHQGWSETVPGYYPLLYACDYTLMNFDPSLDM